MPLPLRGLLENIAITLRITSILLGSLQALLGRQLRVPRAQTEDDQRDGEGDASDAEQSLRGLVGIDDGHSLGGVPGVFGGEAEGVAVGGYGEGGVGGHGGEVGGYLGGEHLGPDGAGDGVAEGAADVVGCEIEGGDDGHVWFLVSAVNLNI